MGEWIKKSSHMHDYPIKERAYVSLGSQWKCVCGHVFEVTSCKRQEGEVLNDRKWILEWKQLTHGGTTDKPPAMPPGDDYRLSGENDQQYWEIR